MDYSKLINDLKESYVGNFTEFRDDYNSGKILVGLDRGESLKVFTYFSRYKMLEYTGEYYTPQRHIVGAFSAFGLFFSISAVILFFVNFAWWGLLLMVACVIAYFINIAISNWPTSSYYDLIVLAIVIALLGFLNIIGSRVFIPLILLNISYFLTRTAYIISPHILRNILTNNETAFNNLRKIMVIKKD